ncbi:MAG TPA: ABC transporter permease [Ohtaekwangia sp.]|uniref:ABC transporter permease n=1 Tax=Ohtaekwangia sp. TaxID=2066019 RepID=UPI002F921B8F
MLKHYLQVVYRSFARYKSTFLINLAGLSAAMACTMLIFLWIQDELQIDKFHQHQGRLFQVMTNDIVADKLVTTDGADAMLGDTWKIELPEVKYTAVITPPSWFSKFTLSTNDHDVRAAGYFASKDYFKVFSFPLMKGNKDHVLADKNSIVISESLAEKLFRTTDCVGKTITWKWFDMQRECVVTGVCNDITAQSTYQFDFLLSFDAWKEIIHTPDVLTPAGPFPTFVVLNDHVDIGQFNAHIAGYIKQKFPKATATLFLRPFEDGYLHNVYENGKPSSGRMVYVKLFAAIAICILLIACVNYMNLFTAKASRRVKEVGIKKAIGASRKTLVTQYIAEALATSFLSLFIAVLIVDLLLQPFNAITGKHLILQVNFVVILSFAGIALLTGLIAGSYPALYLSGFKPAHILKGNIHSAWAEQWARKGLVVFQFVVSIIFMVAVGVVYKQMKFVQEKNLGYNKDNVIYFDMEGNVAVNIDDFLSGLNNLTGVAHASSAQYTIVTSPFEAPGVRWDGKNADDRIRFAPMAVNYGLMETLGMQMQEGRSFSRDFPADTTAVIFNEAAIRAMDLTDPIGKKVNIWGVDRTVVGVVKDFHFQSLHEQVKPFFFRLSPKETIVVMVSLANTDREKTISRIKEYYTKYNPGFAFDYHFLDSDYDAQYIGEQRVSVLSRYFAVLALIISCLGLLGLAAFTAERRRKEISIRKILGSSEVNIIYLVSGDFTKTVFIAIVIALPVSFFIMQYWLSNFAYRIELRWWFFASAGITALLIAWLTVGLQAIRAARVNPTKCLKDE